MTESALCAVANPAVVGHRTIDTPLIEKANP
jgi:hypothetical protein